MQVLSVQLNNGDYMKLKYISWIFALPLYFFSSLLPRRKNLWVFGAWHGDRFGDNSKYFFEYVTENHKEIDAVWMCRSNELLSELTKKGIPAVKINSVKGYFLCATAEYVFTCTGPWDVNRFALFKSNWINLWHGSPLKKIGLDVKRRAPTTTRSISKTLFPFNSERYLLTIAPSEFVESCFRTAFSGLSGDFVRCGYPRNDALNSNEVKNQFLYLPTHRMEGNGSINKIFASLNASALDSALDSVNSKLIIKPHYYDAQAFENVFDGCKNIYIDNASDTYTLMRESAHLISDYSSAMFDYALMERPIIFFAPDLEEYITKERELYINYEAITGNTQLTNWPDLLCAIKNSAKDYKHTHQTINALFNEDINFNYSNKLYKIIRKK